MHRLRVVIIEHVRVCSCYSRLVYTL